jgi:hypothetical protein
MNKSALRNNKHILFLFLQTQSEGSQGKISGGEKCVHEDRQSEFALTNIIYIFCFKPIHL